MQVAAIVAQAASSDTRECFVGSMWPNDGSLLFMGQFIASQVYFGGQSRAFTTISIGDIRHEGECSD